MFQALTWHDTDHFKMNVIINVSISGILIKYCHRFRYHSASVTNYMPCIGQHTTSWCESPLPATLSLSEQHNPYVLIYSYKIWLYLLLSVHHIVYCRKVRKFITLLFRSHSDLIHYSTPLHFSNPLLHSTSALHFCTSSCPQFSPFNHVVKRKSSTYAVFSTGPSSTISERMYVLHLSICSIFLALKFFGTPPWKPTVLINVIFFRALNLKWRTFKST